MANKLSHSSTTKYQTCGKAYYYHYVKRYREKTLSSALIFGAAFDKGFEEMAHGRDWMSMYIKAFTFADVNKQTVYVPDSPIVRYYEADITLFLLQDEDKIKLNAWLAENTPEKRSWDVVFDEIYDEKKAVGINSLKEKRIQFFNLVAWHCMFRKGLLMLEALKTQILSKMTVISTQRELKLKIGEDGDSITGFIDLVAQWQPHENDIVVFDLKTAARAYDADAVTKSPQLALYSHALAGELQTRKAGFIVVCKKLNENKTKKCSVCNFDGSGTRFQTCNNEVAEKRCGGSWVETLKPEVFIQVIIDNIPENYANLVVNNYDEINSAIKSGIFTRNLQSCIQGYGPCAYFKLCHENSEEDIIKLEETNNA